MNSAIQNISAVEEDIGQIRNEEMPMKITGLSVNMHIEAGTATAGQTITFGRAFKNIPYITPKPQSKTTTSFVANATASDYIIIGS